MFLPYLGILDVSHNTISDVDSLHLKLGNVTSLNLSHNHIKSLAGLERLFSLESLDLCNNLISEVQEISRLTGLPNLEILWLQGNPLSEDSDHRVSILSLFEEDHIPVKLDGREMMKSEGRKVWKMREQRKQVEVHQEETICLVEVCEDAVSSMAASGSCSWGEESMTAAISYCDLNLQITSPTSRDRAGILVDIVECEEEEKKDDEIIGEVKKREGEESEEEKKIENEECLTNEDVLLKKIGELLKAHGDNWLSQFINPIFPIVVQPKPPKQPKVLTVTAESLKILEPSNPMLRPLISRDGTESYTTESSRESKESRSENQPPDIPSVIPKPDFSSFHIVPNGVYNIDETVDELVRKYADVPLSELQSTYSVYPEETELLRVLGLNPLKKEPELLEVIPKGGVVTWAMGPGDVISCDLIPGDRISILRKGQEAPNVYSLLFLQDLAHLYHLVNKIKELGEEKGEEEDEGVDPSEKIARQSLDSDEIESGFHSFPTHCFRYSRADMAIPVIVVVTSSEVIILRLENCQLLSLNQDSLDKLMTSSDSDVITCSVLYRNKISQIRQVLSSYFRHSVRIEFRFEGNPFGNPDTTFSFVGYNESDMEKFKDMIMTSLQNEEMLAEEEVLMTESEEDLTQLKRILGVRRLGEIICMSVRLERRYSRCLVLTEMFMFLLEEDIVRWPPPCFVRHQPLTPRFSVLSKLRLRFIFSLTQYTEIYSGSFVLSLKYYTNLKTFSKDGVDLLMSSYENRERVLGHIGRVWRAYYDKDVKISRRRRYEGDGEEQEVTADVLGLCMESFASITMESLQQFTQEKLGDSYNVLYRDRSYCIYSEHPETEFRCAVVMTTENLHVLISSDHVTSEQSTIRHVTPNLVLLVSLPVTDIAQIVIGVFEQKIRFEFGWEECAMITFMTRDLRKTGDLKRAVTGALDCQYQVDSYESDTLITRKGRELSIVTLDDDLDNLRFEIAAHGSSTEDYSSVVLLAYHLVYLQCGPQQPGTRSAVSKSGFELDSFASKMYETRGDPLVPKLRCRAARGCSGGVTASPKPGSPGILPACSDGESDGGQEEEEENSKVLVSVVLADQTVYIIEEDNIFWPLPITSNFRYTRTAVKGLVTQKL
eukprot:sb/3461358/